jgi:rhodanese-related sulfurtransferase
MLADRPDVAVVDVRSPGEFAGVHIDGSCNLPLDVVRKRAGEIVAAVPGPFALLCGSGPRAEEAARVLTSHGAPDVRILDGGIQAWEAGGGEVVRGAGTWAMDRQVRLVAGSLVLAGVLTSVVVPKAKWLAAGIGAGLTFSAITNTCAMARVLGLLPHNRRAGGFDADAAVACLRSR